LRVEFADGVSVSWGSEKPSYSSTGVWSTLSGRRSSKSVCGNARMSFFKVMFDCYSAVLKF